jgi:hypothetical protein
MAKNNAQIHLLNGLGDKLLDINRAIIENKIDYAITKFAWTNVIDKYCQICLI